MIPCFKSGNGFRARREQIGTPAKEKKMANKNNAVSNKESAPVVWVPDEQTKRQKCIVIPDGVTVIGEGAFCGCSSLTSITISDSVTEIGGNAFSDCSSLTSITIPDSVTEIGEEAFSYCSSLMSITIPDSVTMIRCHAFAHCANLTDISYPKTVTFEDGAFCDCNIKLENKLPGNAYLDDDDDEDDCTWG